MSSNSVKTWRSVAGKWLEWINNRMLQSVISTSCTKLVFPTNKSDALKMPKSTLQTHITHGAKSDLNSDFKFETEYLLNCSIPNKPPHEVVFLGECLSEYFTNIVQVRRKLTPGGKAPSINYATKPMLHPPSLYPSSSSPTFSRPSRTPPPPYTGNGNGFYGDEKKKAFGQQEGNVAAWQVHHH